MTALCRECGGLGPRESEPAPRDEDKRDAMEIALDLLRTIADWRGVYDETHDATRERIAAEFRRDTGMLAPGRDYPQADHPPSDSERREAWDTWCARRNLAINDQLRAVLAGRPR